MTSFEPVQAGPYLIPSDAPDLANISKAIVDWAAPRSNMRFASTAARDAAIPSPVEGMVSWLNDTNRLYVHTGTAWVLVSALDDTGWITPALSAGWVSVVTPQYRCKNGIIYFQGRASSTGANAVAFTLPALFRPGVQVVFLAENAGASVRCQVMNSGTVGQVVAAAASSLSFNSCSPFPADA
jgi:hypothetical protein